MQDDSWDASGPKLLNVGSVLLKLGCFFSFPGNLCYVGWKISLAVSCSCGTEQGKGDRGRSSVMFYAGLLTGLGSLDLVP